jgi:hypothetical protein
MAEDKTGPEEGEGGWASVVDTLRGLMEDESLKKFLSEKHAGIPIDEQFNFGGPVRGSISVGSELFITSEGLVRGHPNWKNTVHPFMPQTEVLFILKDGKIICEESNDYLIKKGSELIRSSIDILGELTPDKIRERIKFGKRSLGSQA